MNAACFQRLHPRSPRTHAFVGRSEFRSVLTRTRFSVSWSFRRRNRKTVNCKYYTDIEYRLSLTAYTQSTMSQLCNRRFIVYSLRFFSTITGVLVHDRVRSLQGTRRSEGLRRRTAVRLRWTFARRFWQTRTPTIWTINHSRPTVPRSRIPANLFRRRKLRRRQGQIQVNIRCSTRTYILLYLSRPKTILNIIYYSFISYYLSIKLYPSGHHNYNTAAV